MSTEVNRYVVQRGPDGRRKPHQPPRDEERVLVFTPTGCDGRLTCEILQQTGYHARACDHPQELCEELDRAAGTAILAEEALTPEAMECLLGVLEDQEPWSDVPLIVFTRSGDAIEDILLKLGTAGNVTVLERPVRISTLVSAVNAALRARRRQFQTRDLLQRLEDEGRRKDEFLAMLGHELRNPLGAMRNALHVLERGDSPEGLTHRHLLVLDRQARHLTRMVDDILDVSRVTMGKVALQEQPVDLVALSERVHASLRPLAREHEHAFELELPGEPVFVMGDPVRLEQILTNLIHNAIKYTPDRGEIRLSLAVEGKDAVVRVRDNGIGIAPEMLSGIFELFRQAEVSLARSEGGLGLGLTLVKNLVEMHRGSVRVHSEGTGYGSEFEVRLPRLQHAAEPPASPHVEAAPQARRRVLLVEDNADGRATLSELLELWGHEVEVTEDGEQGLARALERVPDVMLVDIGLPGLDGFQVAQRVHASFDGNRPGLIAMTGYGQPQDRQKALDAGFDVFLVKPVDPKELSRLVATVQAKPKQK